MIAWKNPTRLNWAPRLRKTATGLERMAPGFVPKQDGSMSYFAVAGSVVMMVFGGIGIDLAYTELKRTKVQNTLDRAVLAAANMTSETPPEEVVTSYFRASGIEEALGAISVDETLTSRTVSADGSSSMPSMFMRLLGVNSLRAEGDATAQQAVNNIEISLVLDVSGSMYGEKLDQLKTAAAAFINEILPQDNDGTVTVSVIPYNATVNLGETLAQYYTLENLHNFSHCAYFPTAAFTEASVDRYTELGQLAHFDPYGWADGNAAVTQPWCAENDDLAVIAHSSDPQELIGHINSFEAAGNTAIDLGMKWGVALLSPDSQSLVDDVVFDGLIDRPATTRPAAWNDPTTLKYIVVMTDGENTTQFDLVEERKSGMSEVWINQNGTIAPNDDTFSVQVLNEDGTAQGEFFQPDLAGTEAAYQAAPFGDVSLAGGSYLVASNAAATPASGGSGGTGSLSDPRQLSNIELFARVRTPEFANGWYYQMYLDGRVTWDQYIDAFYSYEPTVDYEQADTNLSSMCQTARDQGIVVFAVGVEAPQRGLDAMSDCASSPSHYFDVAGDNLVDTFAAIARTLQQLRLIH